MIPGCHLGDACNQPARLQNANFDHVPDVLSVSTCLPGAAQSLAQI